MQVTSAALGSGKQQSRHAQPEPPKHNPYGVELILVAPKQSIRKAIHRYPLDSVFLYKNRSLIISAIRKGVLLLRSKIEVFVTNY